MLKIFIFDIYEKSKSFESKAEYKVIKEVSTKLNLFARLSHALWSPTNTLAAAQGLAVELVVDLEDSYHDMRRKEDNYGAGFE